jgi:hypothetical protein
VTSILGVVAAAIALLALGVWGSRRTRAKLAARLRAEWGYPKSRLSEELAAYYDEAVHRKGGERLDGTTWADLMPEDVFNRMDRAESVFGREVLYHRLRRLGRNPSDLLGFEGSVE